jgi:hypothetical protein
VSWGGSWSGVDLGCGRGVGLVEVWVQTGLRLERFENSESELGRRGVFYSASKWCVGVE